LRRVERKPAARKKAKARTASSKIAAERKAEKQRTRESKSATPRDPYDIAFEEMAAEWNLFLFNAFIHSDQGWRDLLLNDEPRQACLEYARTRYLGLLSDEEVCARYRTLQIGLLDMDEEGYLEPNGWTKWSDKWVHTAMELTPRNLSLGDERCKADWSFVRTPLVLRAVAARSRRKLQWGKRVLVKYGSRRFLRAALEEGVIRISPASSYNDPSLNVARQDQELERQLIDSAFEMTATLGQIRNKLSKDDREAFSATIQSATDYYIFCLAAGYQLRLFDDFEADACLVITDPKRFVRQLFESAADKLPGWLCKCEFVRYIDPVQRLTGSEKIDREQFAPFFCKDFRYSYQKEVRAAWVPPDPKAPCHSLDHLFLNLGSLADYCEIIEL
jgi:hypothetical protein